MKAHPTPPLRLADSHAATHFQADSALSEFIAGRLGAPSCWPDESHRTSAFLRRPDEMSSIQRWENEGGKAVTAVDPAKGPAFAIPSFYSTRPLLTQLL